MEASAPTKVPFCCFNGGVDVWCDVGNVAIGYFTLQALINARGRAFAPHWRFFSQMATIFLPGRAFFF